jgi:transposase
MLPNFIYSMVSLVKKTIKGCDYLYLRQNKWIDGKSKCVMQIYLGSEEELKKTGELRFNRDPLVDTFDFGLPCAIYQILQRLDLIQIIDDCVPKRNQGLSVGRYLAIAIMNRCIQPCSKAKIRQWFESGYLTNFFSSIDEYLNADAYANHFAYLDDEIIETIETKLMAKVQQEFGIKWDQLMFDPTNFYTYINPDEDCELPKHGHSKENRMTLNLIGLSLVTTSDGGIPLLSHIYPGNQQDAAVFRKELPHLKERLKKLHIDPNSLMLIFDKGNLSEDAFKLLQEMNLPFLSSIRPSTVKEFHSIVAEDFPSYTLPNNKQVGILERTKEMYGQQYRLLIVHNPSQAEWNDLNLQKKLLKELDAVNGFFAERLNQSHWKKKEKIEAKIKTMIPKKHLPYFSIEVTGIEGQFQLKLQILSQVIKSNGETLGKTYLITSDQSTPAKDLVWRFRQQYLVERCFKYLKRPDLLSVRPMYHWTDSSIRGHLFTCVLGLLVLSLLTKEIQKFDSDATFESILEDLDQIKVSTIKLPGWNGSIKKTNRMNENSEKLYNKLNLVQYL